MFGGDGITPDYCVEPERPSKFVSYLIGRQAFTGFAHGFSAAEGQGDADIAGAGTRSSVVEGDVQLIATDFEVDDVIRAEFEAYLVEQKLRFEPEDLEENRQMVDRLVEEEVVRQVFGEGAARRRSIRWDPQVQRALELVPTAELLLGDPNGFVAQREQERQVADVSLSEPVARP